MADDIVRWITVNGVHIPIKEGQTADEAIKERQIGKSKEEAKQKNSETPKDDVYESIRKLGLKDNLNYKDWERENMDKLRAWAKEHRDVRNLTDTFKQVWYDQRHDEEIKHLHEITPDEFHDNIHMRDYAMHMWYTEANSDYKPELADSIFNNHETLNAGLNIAYAMYRSKWERWSSLNQEWQPWDSKVNLNERLSFKEWLYTPQTLYRGTDSFNKQPIASDIFMAYSSDKRIAEKFGRTGSVESIQIRPIDTWGCYQYTGEEEYSVPIKWLRENKK